jgi:uncharacterized Zn-finger protein
MVANGSITSAAASKTNVNVSTVSVKGINDVNTHDSNNKGSGNGNGSGIVNDGNSTMIGNEEKRFTCNLCGKGFTQKGGLVRHYITLPHYFLSLHQPLYCPLSPSPMHSRYHY